MIRRSILLAKTTAAQNEVALSYHKVCELYFLAVVFVANILYVTFHGSTVHTTTLGVPLYIVRCIPLACDPPSF